VSRQNLRKRLRYHYRGNAYGSTLRLTLGALLNEQLIIQLRRVGSGSRPCLKESLLSWDRVALIRPTGVEASVAAAGPVERSIYQHEDFVDPVTPDNESLERVYDAFSNSDQASLDQLQRRYGPEARDRLAAPARPTRQAAQR
jgi:hypothetical protein